MEDDNYYRRIYRIIGDFADWEYVGDDETNEGILKFQIMCSGVNIQKQKRCICNHVINGNYYIRHRVTRDIKVVGSDCVFTITGFGSFKCGKCNAGGRQLLELCSKCRRQHKKTTCSRCNHQYYHYNSRTTSELCSECNAFSSIYCNQCGSGNKENLYCNECAPHCKKLALGGKCGCGSLQCINCDKWVKNIHHLCLENEQLCVGCFPIIHCNQCGLGNSKNIYCAACTLHCGKLVKDGICNCGAVQCTHCSKWTKTTHRLCPVDERLCLQCFLVSHCSQCGLDDIGGIYCATCTPHCIQPAQDGRCRCGINKCKRCNGWVDGNEICHLCKNEELLCICCFNKRSRWSLVCDNERCSGTRICINCKLPHKSSVKCIHNVCLETCPSCCWKKSETSEGDIRWKATIGRFYIMVGKGKWDCWFVAKGLYDKIQNKKGILNRDLLERVFGDVARKYVSKEAELSN